jgi:hypothetical protein
VSDYASLIATTAYNLLAGGFGPAFKTYRKTPMLQVQPNNLPVLSVLILRERREQDGQSNQAEPKFIHALTLGISGAVQIETDSQNELSSLEDTMSYVDALLLGDSRFVNLTEGILSMDRLGQYAKLGEITLYEIRVEMVVQFRSYWPPNVTDMLEKVVITTQFPDKAHVDSGTPQLEQVIELDTGS